MDQLAMCLVQKVFFFFLRLAEKDCYLGKDREYYVVSVAHGISTSCYKRMRLRPFHSLSRILYKKMIIMIMIFCIQIQLLILHLIISRDAANFTVQRQNHPFTSADELKSYRGQDRHLGDRHKFFRVNFSSSPSNPFASPNIFF